VVDVDPDADQGGAGGRLRADHLRRRRGRSGSSSSTTCRPSSDTVSPPAQRTESGAIEATTYVDILGTVPRGDRLAAAMPAWRPISDLHIAPVVLFTDPRLAQMLTPNAVASCSGLRAPHLVTAGLPPSSLLPWWTSQPSPSRRSSS
jgi:hypothetical protein